jgi:O-succinylbenzoic acid--CoA ligase
MITKCKDEKFGEAVVLLTESDAIDSLQKICQKVLPKYWCPRHYIQIESLPFTATGKPARKEAEHLASLAVEV